MFRSLLHRVLAFDRRNKRLLAGTPVPRSVRKLKVLAFAQENRVAVGVFASKKSKKTKPSYKVVIWQTFEIKKKRHASTTLFPDQLIVVGRLLEDCRAQLVAQK